MDRIASGHLSLEDYLEWADEERKRRREDHEDADIRLEDIRLDVFQDDPEADTEEEEDDE